MTPLEIILSIIIIAAAITMLIMRDKLNTRKDEVENWKDKFTRTDDTRYRLLSELSDIKSTHRDESAAKTHKIRELEKLIQWEKVRDEHHHWIEAVEAYKADQIRIDDLTTALIAQRQQLATIITQEDSLKRLKA